MQSKSLESTNFLPSNTWRCNFDRGKGYINHEDLKEMLGSDYDKQTVYKMIEEGDFKKNNQIDYEELLHYMFSDPAQGDKLVGHVTPQRL